eukprot:CAMPEP_0167765062 /NCGR_PEP_ID=MMETSP0110_2-20121227/14444_1 /TAXON_ID=629695 /ORGANISM="Gymnochlora sp., Strain CCMP2014" /LENGTH=111 /DNA_ID=CAMNT_0007652665 /DNA_START=627 /DNA_END=958 /DNA_ORIENTATION=-
MAVPQVIALYIMALLLPRQSSNVPSSAPIEESFHNQTPSKGIESPSEAFVKYAEDGNTFGVYESKAIRKVNEDGNEENGEEVGQIVWKTWSMRYNNRALTGGIRPISEDDL